ncbi:hypothetical protein LguiA_017152 [Lonicera macranthoides]
MIGSDICPRRSSTLHELLDPHPYRGTDLGSRNPETYNAFLWNPATKEFWNLPAPTFNLPPNNCTYDNSAFNFRFGLDPFTNDYKVVLILFYDSINNRPFDHPHPPPPPCIAVVSVYSLAANSWRPVNNVLPSVSGIFTPRYYIVRGHNCTYQNEAFYWMSSDQRDNSVIVMFDMTKEVFRDIEPPACFSKVQAAFVQPVNHNMHQIRDIGTKRNIFKVFNYKETVAPIMPRSRKLQEVTPATGFLPFTRSSSILSASAVVPAEMERLRSLRAENQALMARIEALEAARAAEAEAHRVEKEAMLAREAKFDKLFDMLSASGS